MVKQILELKEIQQVAHEIGPSLSAIAGTITGTRWNGLAFFGLTRPSGGERKEPPCAKQ